MKFKWNSGRLWLRILVLTTGLLIVLASIQGVVYWRFNPQDVRDAIARSLNGTGRVVQIEDIKPRLLPSPGLILERITLSDRDGKTPIGNADRLEIRISWWQWLTGDYEIRSIRLDRASLKLSRRADGNMSLNDLFRRNQNQKYHFRLDTLKVRNSTLVFDDLVTGQSGRLEAVDLDALDLRSDDAELNASARLFDGRHNVLLTVATPMVIQDDQVRIDALDLLAQSNTSELGQSQLTVKGKLRLNFAALRAEGEALTLTLNNESPRSVFTLNLPQVQADFDRIDAERAALTGTLDSQRGRYQFNGTLDKLHFAGGVFAVARMNGQLDWQSGRHTVSLNVTTPLRLMQRTLDFKPMTLKVSAATPFFPRNQLRANLSGGGSAALDKAVLDLSVAGKFDEADLKVVMRQQGWLNSYRQAEVELVRLDLNRYLPKEADDPVALLNSAERINLNWLDYINADLRLTIGELAVGRFHLNQVMANIKANPRTLQLNDVTADIYKGKLAGSLKLVRDGVIKVEAKQKLTNVSITPVLSDLFGFHRLEGRGDSMFEVTAQGNSYQAWRDTLTGDMAMSLSDGALTGIDLVAALKNLPAELRDANNRIAAKTDQRTAFSKLSATIRLNNGVARNRNLQLSSELVNLTGHGKLDLVNSIVDYTMDVRANPREFERFRDVNVPLKITGPISSPVYALDFNAMVKGKKTDAERQDALKEQLKKQIGSMLP